MKFIVLKHPFVEGEPTCCTVREQLAGERVGQTVPSGNHSARIVGLFDRLEDAETYAAKRAE